MRKAYLSLTVSIRTTLVFLIALVAGALALLSLGTGPAESQQAPAQSRYEVQDLGTLGGSYSTAAGINNSNQVVGASTPSDGAAQHAFLYSDGQMSDLGTLGGSPSMATGINNSNQVVGLSITSDGTQHAFLYSDGQMNDLGTLGGIFSAATGINDAGKVVGASYTSGDAAQHAFLYSDGQMSDLGTLGGSFDTAATGINDANQVVGLSKISGDTLQHAFLYSGEQMMDLGTLAGSEPFSESRAWGINDAGKVVGDSTTRDGGQHAFLYSGGVMRDLNSLIPADSGWELISAKAINDNGYIVGEGINNDGQTRAFLLTPHFDGFYQPVDNLPTLNKTKPGKTIPIRFSWGIDEGLDIFAEGYPKSEAIPCDSTATVDGIEETATGKGGLSYNARTKTYEYAWATSSTWSGCRQFVMKLKDGTVQRANFIFR